MLDRLDVSAWVYAWTDITAGSLVRLCAARQRSARWGAQLASDETNKQNAPSIC
jgi:hypothetical protein